MAAIRNACGDAAATMFAIANANSGLAQTSSYNEEKLIAGRRGVPSRSGWVGDGFLSFSGTL
jgi:hypothetical protein